MDQSIRVVLVDDHALVRAGIREYLDRADGIEVVGEAGSGEEAKRIIEQHCDQWIGESPETVHIDLHSGLGPYASCKLLLAAGTSESERCWHEETFGRDIVESGDESQRTAYTIRGEFGEWMRDRYKSRRYRFALAEFGTYRNVRVLRAMRNENRLFHFGDRAGTAYLNSRRELLECFCPRDERWRTQVIHTGLAILDMTRLRLLQIT